MTLRTLVQGIDFRKATDVKDPLRPRIRCDEAPHSAEPREHKDELPLRVCEAARYLGVSRQTVYLWVERKQIPHFRVMGRNIRFLKSELQLFRAQFKQEVENWQDQ
jgi:excisionase family DNA binding protein